MPKGLRKINSFTDAVLATPISGQLFDLGQSCGVNTLSPSPMQTTWHPPAMNRRFLFACALLGSLILGACGSPPRTGGSAVPDLDDSAWAQSHALPAAPPGSGWRHQRIGQRKPTEYRPVQHAGRPALQALSQGGDSLMRHALDSQGPDLGLLDFSWYLDQHNPLADIGDAHADDAPLRLILQFDGDRSRFTARDQRISDLLQTLTGEPMPYATLMYVWDPKRPVGTVIPHPRSSRVRKLVVVSGTEALGRWMDLRRDLRADYLQAFGEPPARLTGIALMTDSNNTGVRSQAWYGPLRWVPAGKQPGS